MDRLALLAAFSLAHRQLEAEERLVHRVLREMPSGRDPAETVAWMSRAMQTQVRLSEAMRSALVLMMQAMQESDHD